MKTLALIALIAACSPDRGPRWREAGATTPRAGGTLRIASQTAITTLDPAVAYDETSIAAIHMMVDGLVGYAVDSTAVEPRLAERWDISPDGLTYRFTLRAGLTYADGKRIVARDFERALERALAMKDSPYGSHLAGVAGAQAVLEGKTTDCTGIVTIDDRTLELRLTAPNAAMLYELAMPFAAPLTEESLAGAPLRRGPLPSGPYELVEWDEGRRIELVRRAHYHDPTRQRIERIVLLENVPRDLQFMMFERGELDAAERLTASDLRWIQQQPAWAPHLKTRALMNAFGSRMNVREKPFDDKRVRQAMNYAVDKQRIVKLLTGTAVSSHGVLAPGAFGRDDTIAPYPHDPAKARALLAEAGYPDGFSLDYMTLADEEAEKLAVSLKADLAAVGIDMSITQVTFSAFADAISKPTGPKFSIVTWVGDFPDPLSLLDPLFHSRYIAEENATNFSFFKNTELDGILDAARGETDLAKRAALYKRAERILYDEAPWIWGYHQLMTEVTHPYVRGYQPHPIWVRDYTPAWLDLGADGERVER
ncbi:MAG: ABC transporter substrate-binding protein [Deltaproteobacteria bacterium]|nr:ABC transporter substrate-binding protein [Deltaproteobacteria bacterium]